MTFVVGDPVKTVSKITINGSNSIARNTHGVILDVGAYAVKVHFGGFAVWMFPDSLAATPLLQIY